MPGPDQATQRASMARVGSLLLLAGAVLVTAIVIAPHPEELDERAYLGIAVAAAAAAALLTWIGGRMPMLGFHLFPAFGTVLVSLTIYYSGDTGAGANELLYFWPIIYASYFLGRRGLAFQVVF